MFVRRRPSEELLDRCVQPTVKFQGGGIMVWGTVSYWGTGLLYHVQGNLNAAGYIKILLLWLLIFLGTVMKIGINMMVLHIRAQIVKKLATVNDFRCLENWLPQSPYLNPIGNLWHDIKFDLKRRQHHIHRDLANNVRDCCNSLTSERSPTLVRSMPKRIQAVLVARGRHTKHWRKIFHSQFIILTLKFCNFCCIFFLLYKLYFLRCIVFDDIEINFTHLE